MQKCNKTVSITHEFYSPLGQFVRMRSMQDGLSQLLKHKVITRTKIFDKSKTTKKISCRI